MDSEFPGLVLGGIVVEATGGTPVEGARAGTRQFIAHGGMNRQDESCTQSMRVASGSRVAMARMNPAG